MKDVFKKISELTDEMHEQRMTYGQAYLILKKFHRFMDENHQHFVYEVLNTEERQELVGYEDKMRGWVSGRKKRN